MLPERKGTGTVGKALSVLDDVAAFERPVRFTEILATSSFPKGSLYRFLQNLTNEGMLSYDPKQQTYSLGVRLVRLAHAAWAQSSMAPVARPYLDALSEQIGETIHLAQLDNAHVLYVDKRNAKNPVEMFSQAGKIGPAYCTGVGKAMMAFLPEAQLDRILPQQSYHRFTQGTLCSEQELCAELKAIRGRGYAFDREEHEPGIICVAVPILTAAKHTMGAISVTSSTTTKTLKQLEQLVPQMREATQRIASEAEYWRFPSEQKSTK